MIDIILSACGIVVLMPVWLILAIAIKIDDPGPIFFRQKRIAQDKDGQQQFFQIYKYRSMKMCTPRDCPTHLLENPEQYITKVGGFLRKTSLDELPQLWNVLMGDMSIVGPRPALPRETEQYDEKAWKRTEVLPGLTCYWQIQPKRNSLSFEKWLELDMKYIRERSFLVDWKIMFATIGAVLHMEGE